MDLLPYSIEPHKRVYKSLNWDIVMVVLPYVGGYRFSVKVKQESGDYAIVETGDLLNKGELDEKTKNYEPPNG